MMCVSIVMVVVGGIVVFGYCFGGWFGIGGVV